MTIEEIKQELRDRGWTQRKFASVLGIHEVTVAMILSGKYKLTQQMDAHIEALFNDAPEQILIHRVRFPDMKVEFSAPGFENLTPRQQILILMMFLEDMTDWVLAEKSHWYDEERLTAIRDFNGQLKEMIARRMPHATENANRPPSPKRGRPKKSDTPPEPEE